ncbi:MAG: NAD(P)-dependent glycerol-3-phosphate dehydrogenase [Deltaproteobacteria bacterium]|nr:NAD(P)-dependent glycerol-3-phosphate dehydrogenase [Deltaproteobacteria bacterium]MBW2071368.1 NAD(P)-dependent glycerol-3-phosphate dehydrogenase [Deltaproteobacteria bacterium]
MPVDNSKETATEAVGVVGAGSWGTALANLLASKKMPVYLWVYEKDLCRHMQEKRENSLYLPGVRLASLVMPESNLERVVLGRRFLLMVVPSHVYRRVASQMVDLIGESTVIVSATKGIENDTLKTMWGIWQEIIPAGLQWYYAVLSGPSFAREVVQSVPTAVTVASPDKEVALEVQRLFSTAYFRVYSSTDVTGVELGGALKNVIALAAGIVDGLGLGHNTRAALITRGLAEMSRLGTSMGAHPLTFLGLAGVGDLMLTCTGDLSRNRTVGYQLGQGKKLTDILAEMQMVAEGVKTTRSAYYLAKRQGVEMPICKQMYRILYEDLPPKAAISELMTRGLKHELETFFA